MPPAFQTCELLFVRTIKNLLKLVNWIDTILKVTEKSEPVEQNISVRKSDKQCPSSASFTVISWRITLIYQLYLGLTSPKISAAL